MTIALSPVAVLNAMAGLGRHGEVRDLAYGPHPRHRLDVYCPLQAAAARPVVMFFYGGGWEEGERADYRFVGAALAAQGIVAIIPDYRVYPEVRFPAFLDDAADATRWARDHAADFRGDATRMVLMGHSAGAHMAAMLALDRKWLGTRGLAPERDLRGMVGLSGPYDFLPLRSPRLKDIFGPEARWRDSQPIHFVDGTAPPVFLASGQVDTVVDPGNAARLAGRIRTAGGEARVRLYPRVGHPTILGALAPVLRPLAPVLRDTTDFIREVTAAAVASPIPIEAHA